MSVAFGDTISTVAPASTISRRGSVSSTCSKPSVARIAIRLFRVFCAWISLLQKDRDGMIGLIARGGPDACHSRGSRSVRSLNGERIHLQTAFRIHTGRQSGKLNVRRPVLVAELDCLRPDLSAGNADKKNSYALLLLKNRVCNEKLGIR